MKLLKNQGTDRVIDELRTSLSAGGSLDAASHDLSLFAYGELREVLRRLSGSRLIVSPSQAEAQPLLGSDADRGARNQLSSHKLARDLADWLRKSVEVKAAPGPLPQATLVAKNADGTPVKVISGNCPLTKAGETIVHNGVTIIGALNLAGALAGNASSLYARNLQNFLDLIVTKEGALAIDWEDEIINGTALVKQGSAVHPLLNA
jgi:hypothetical protein